MTQTLTISSTLLCPHGGQVKIIPAQTNAQAGDPMATVADTYIIVGCPFTNGPIASPCVRVQWTKVDTKTQANNQPTVSRTSVGLCLAATGAPQGTAIVVNTQSKVSSS